GFFASKSVATQRIVLASMFHSWHQMAEATRARRDELLRKWTEAMSFRNRQVLRHTLGNWRRATERASVESGGSYERVQLKLATMHCRHLFLRRAFARLADSWALQQRLHAWEAEAPQRLVAACWIKWRGRLAQQKSAAISHASDCVQQAARTNALRRALRCWRHQAELHDKEHMFAQWRAERLLSACVGAWRQHRAQARVQERDKETHKRQQLLAWRAVAQHQHSLEERADAQRRRGLLYGVLSRLFSAQQARMTADAQAQRFRRYQAMARVFDAWRHVSRTHRDSQLQARAIRDLARRRDHKRRRLVLAAWRQVAGRVGQAESYAVELVARRQRAMLVNCFRQWYASCSFHRGMPPPPPPPPPPMKCPLPTPVSAPVTHAQTMTSGEISRRERAVSIQTESDDRQDLLRRVRVAEEEARRYRSLYVDPAQVRMDLVAHEEQLDGLLDQWNHSRRSRLLQSVFRQLRARHDDAKRGREQEAQLAAAHSDNRLRLALRQWQGLAQAQARDAAAADEHHRRRQMEALHGVLFEWRAQLKDKRQLLMSAAKRHHVNTARRFLATMGARLARHREMELEARSIHRKLELSRAWTQINRIYARARTSRVLASMHISDSDALRSIDQAGKLDSTAIIDSEELDTLFGAWRLLVDDARETQGAVMDRLPPLLRQRAVASLATGFDWGLLRQGRLLTSSLRQWRHHLSTTRAARSSVPRTNEGDGPNALELQRYEKLVSQGRSFRLAQTAFHRWVTANRGKLLAQRQLSQSLKRLVSMIASRVRQVKVAREKERLFQLRPAVSSWRVRLFVNVSRMDNAQVHANASCVRLCLLHWRAQLTHPQQPTTEGGPLYMKAIAFRWERQARRALTCWMEASGDERVRVRVAQRAGRLREMQLARVADAWARGRVLGRAVKKMRGVARRRAAQHEMSWRLATAWGNANVQRYALGVWRQRLSPSSSMYFSVAESPV
ncbi:hypothetical protein GGI24_003521, partial [Coemansia furcata]